MKNSNFGTTVTFGIEERRQFRKTNLGETLKVDGETVETVADYFSGLQNHCRW